MQLLIKEKYSHTIITKRYRFCCLNIQIICQSVNFMYSITKCCTTNSCVFLLETGRKYFPKRSLSAELHTLSEIHHVPFGLSIPPHLGQCLSLLQSTKDDCHSTLDDLSVLFNKLFISIYYCMFYSNYDLVVHIVIPASVYLDRKLVY